jgi:hypothetical protein
MTPENAPLPAQFKRRIGTTVALFATPYSVPAEVVATCVPWPLQSRVPHPSLKPENTDDEERTATSFCSRIPLSTI